MKLILINTADIVENERRYIWQCPHCKIGDIHTAVSDVYLDDRGTEVIDIELENHGNNGKSCIGPVVIKRYAVALEDSISNKLVAELIEVSQQVNT